jgi:hypothetical protein
MEALMIILHHYHFLIGFVYLANHENSRFPVRRNMRNQIGQTDRRGGNGRFAMFSFCHMSHFHFAML